MATEKEITSTEKLLNVIRGGKEDEFPGIKTPQKASKRKERKKRGVGKQKGVSVGIDIGYTQLRLVKIVETAGKGWMLLDYTRIPLEKGIERGTQQFADFLKAELSDYCGSTKGITLWALMSAANVEVQNISVPKVAKKELRNVVLWTAKQESAFNEEEVVFDFEVQGEVIEKGIEKYGVLFYTTPKKEVEDTRALFEKIGFPLDGLTIAPLALQNLFRTNWIPAFEKTVAALYIGRSWSRIDIFSKGNLVMTRGIKAGINSMVESLVEEYEEKRRQRSNQRPTIEMPPFGENPSTIFDVPTGDGENETVAVPRDDETPMDLDQARELIAALSPDAPPAEELYDRFGLDKAGVFDMIDPALERLVRQVERTFEHYSVTMGRESVNAVYVSTAMDVYLPIVDYIGGQLAIASDVLDPLDPAHQFVGGVTSASNISERSAFVPVLGVALSDMSRTLNLIYTSEDKEKRKRLDWANKSIMAGFLVIMMAVFGYYLYLDGIVHEKQRSAFALEKKLSQNVQVDEAMILTMVSEVKKEQEAMQEIKKRYVGVVAFGEIARITPEPVRLISVKADWGEAGEKDDKGAKGLVMEGLVSGASETLDSTLAAYIVKLQSSPLFDKASIKTKKPEKRGARDMLRFTVTAALN